MTADERHDLGLAVSAVPETIGDPGKRTFNITVESDRGRAVIWMEKEQLFQIAVAIKQFLASHGTNPEPGEFTPEHPYPPSSVSVEFKTGEMTLRHDYRSDAFTIEATDAESEQEGDDEEPAPALQFSFKRSTGNELAERALEILAAGRKPCPLCGGPQDPGGHFCVRLNGHRTAQDDEA